MVIVTKLMYRFYTVSIRIPPDLFVEIDKLTLEFKCNVKELRTVKTTLKMKNKLGKSTLS